MGRHNPGSDQQFAVQPAAGDAWDLSRRHWQSGPASRDHGRIRNQLSETPRRVGQRVMDPKFVVGLRWAPWERSRWAGCSDERL